MGERQTEIVIIGGGVIGTSIAYHLARRGAQVTLVERADLAAQASGASAGGVRQINRDPREMPLAMRSIERWRTLEAELEADVEYRMGGQLYVTEDETDVSLLKEKVAQQQALGLEVHFVEGDELREIAPNLAPTVQWGMTTYNDGQASAPQTTRAFAIAAERHGASIQTGTDVRSIQCSGSRISGVETTSGPIACDRLVLAAGAWSPPLARQLGIELPVTTMGLQMMSTAPAGPMLAQTVGAVRRKLSLKQVPDGSFVIGGGWPGDVDVERGFGTTRLSSIRGSIEHATAIMPALGSLPLQRVWIGLEALAIDGIPILGGLPGIDNVTIATGFSGHGFALSPIVGQLLSELIVDGAPSIPLDDFSFDRFASMDPAMRFPDWQAG
jgi:sarcosine oxidase subunit beta